MASMKRPASPRMGSAPSSPRTSNNQSESSSVDACSPKHIQPVDSINSQPIKTIAPQADRSLIYPVHTVGMIGAPLCDGQNLEGADLAPLAMRDAGIATLVKGLGYKWQDWGDINFDKRYEELGLARKRRKTGKASWVAWKKTGCHQSFSEWCKENGLSEAAEQDMSPASLAAKKSGDRYDNVVNANLIGPALELVYKRCLEVVKKKQFLLTIGGDHSIATSTIAAMSSVYKDLAVIWIDAHGDANTPDSSPSLHYHGMPVGHLLGWFKRHPKGFGWMPSLKCIEESHFAYIGLRDIDPEEGKMMRNSDLHIYTMREVDKYGIARVVEEALNKIDPNKKRPIHLSLDVDGIDPQVAPGTGTCARGGLSYREIHYICEELALTRRLVSMDLVEINPGLDPAPQPKLHGDDASLNVTTPTIQLGVELVLSSLGKTIMGNA